MMKNIFTAMIACSCISLSSVASAADKFYCDALRDEAEYGKKYKAYKFMVPGQDNWVFRSNSDFINEVPVTDKAIKKIKRIHDEFEKQGIDFVMLFPPTRGMLHSDKMLAEEAEKYGYTDSSVARASYADFINKLAGSGIKIVGLPDQPVGEPFFYERDHHWSPAGARIAANATAEFVKGLKSYEGLEKKEYITTSKGEIDFNSTSDKIFKNICDTVLPSQKIEIFETNPADAASGDDLFGDVAEPEVVLLGTSNSTKIPSHANFEGFLKDALSTDILNKSISGGSIDSALMSYLNTDHYKKKKSKVLIWEVPGYYDMTRWEGRIYRQVTPAIHGDCEGDDIVEVKGHKLNKGISLLMKDLDRKGIDSANYYVSLNFSKPIKSKYTINFTYSNKKRDKLSVSRSKRYPHDGQYFIGLKDVNYGALSKVILDVPSDMAGVTVDARICKMK